MDILIIFLKIYLVFVVIFIVFYMIRHYIFTCNRVFGEQRMYYHDIIDSDLPLVSVLIPMHNEEKVASNILDALIKSDYPKEKLEIIPINDHSTDRTKEILNHYAKKFNFIKPFHREDETPRGKPVALNDALKVAKGEIIVIYDADYIPPKGQIRELIIAFKDIEIGAVMGRVIPINTDVNLLTRLIDLERAGGYQVDQQARYNLGLIPQFGGTVGAFKKQLIIDSGGFDENSLTEDTELTFRLYLKGYKIAYANKAECYEEAPESWEARAKQIRRWSRGHNQVLFKYLRPLWRSNLSFWQKVDGSLLLLIYVLPFLTLLALFNSLTLFFLGEIQIVINSFLLLAILSYTSFGNFAPFFEIALAGFIDGVKDRIKLLTFFCFVFVFNIFYTSLGFIDAIIDFLTKRERVWEKTERFRSI